MSSHEGVIKYQLTHHHHPLPDAIDLSEIERWRQHFHRLGLIARDPSRYEGLDFGNISRRHPLPGHPDAFIISGSQTAHLAKLDASGYALVTDFDIGRNTLSSIGSTPPSSEALTHAVIYQRLPEAHGVIHVHDPRLWRAATAIGLPVTSPEVEYGTVAMAHEIQRILDDGSAKRHVLSMGGHEDGIITWGETLAEAAERLTRLHQRVG